MPHAKRAPVVVDEMDGRTIFFVNYAAFLSRAYLWRVVSPSQIGARPTASGAKLPFYHVAHEYDVALLFVGALVAFCVSLIELGREARLALHDNNLRK